MSITSECKYQDLHIRNILSGDSIAAYTTDHVSHSNYKYGILPDTEYTNNDLMKVAGVVLDIGISICGFVWGIKLRK